MHAVPFVKDLIKGISLEMSQPKKGYRLSKGNTYAVGCGVVEAIKLEV